MEKLMHSKVSLGDSREYQHLTDIHIAFLLLSEMTED